MIEFAQEGVVLALPPRTGSTAIVMAARKWPGAIIRSNTSHGHHWTSGLSVPQGHRFFVVVRHPFDRIQSLWRWLLALNPSYGPQAESAWKWRNHVYGESIGFDEFLCHDRTEELLREGCWSVMWHVKRLGRLDGFIRWEMLAQDLGNLVHEDFPCNLARINMGAPVSESPNDDNWGKCKKLAPKEWAEFGYETCLDRYLDGQVFMPSLVDHELPPPRSGKHFG